MFNAKIVSSQEKIFPKNKIEDFTELKRISVLKGERLSFQFIHTCNAKDNFSGMKLDFKIEGDLANYSTARDVCYVPVSSPVTNGVVPDDGYLSTDAGVFPDILRPLHYGSKITSIKELSSVFITVDIPRDCKAGIHTLEVKFDARSNGITSRKIEIEVINQEMDEENIFVTQWLHCDSIAGYYDIPVFSEKHWKIIENFARVAFKNGINVIYTPLFTPPLDTAVGGERLTTQLVDVSINKGKLSFNFDKLERFFDMASNIGYKNFEMSHLFTQWGAEHAPKIMATVDGEYKKIFGWETDAKDEKYISFLRSFLTLLVEFLKKRKNIGKVFFHISDEPHNEHLDYYIHDKNAIADIVKDYQIIDALSSVEFYKKGAVSHPVPSSNHIEDFLNENIKDLWVYYCCSQWKDVSNRFQAQPACRNRSIGMQIYKYNIVGFLHWGYNFYQNHYSGDFINPYYEQNGDSWISAGDGFSVYPSMRGEALESPRLIVFNEALQDIKAMKIAERFYGHSKVVEEIEKIHGQPIKFNSCAKTGEEIIAIREKINEMIKEKVQ